MAQGQEISSDLSPDIALKQHLMSQQAEWILLTLFSLVT